MGNTPPEWVARLNPQNDGASSYAIGQQDFFHFLFLSFIINVCVDNISLGFSGKFSDGSIQSVFEFFSFVVWLARLGNGKKNE